jgi:hypothetical protein
MRLSIGKFICRVSASICKIQTHTHEAQAKQTMSKRSPFCTSEAWGDGKRSLQPRDLGGDDKRSLGIDMRSVDSLCAAALAFATSFC